MGGGWARWTRDGDWNKKKRGCGERVEGRKMLIERMGEQEEKVRRRARGEEGHCTVL